mgnify:CR=1 FL=1
MIRKKEPKVIITFHTTAGAIELERSCKAEKIPGRIIPVPRELSAGCGLAWCAPLEDREKIAAVMKETGIEEEAMHECMV